MDRLALRPLPRLPAGAGGAGRVQRQVHVQPDGASRRLVRHAALAPAPQLPQLLPARGALAVHRNPPGERPMSRRTTPPVIDAAPETAPFRAEVLRGLRRRFKTLPCKYFYDETRSRPFDRICQLDEYYLTRTERAIIRRHP